ncbi:aminopeptidase N isoform X2 [Drosophila ficusphila]|uniref:aminopeptidase N isoform X2 n=1 Tax=Drosophila ficusphila TaxID=30025 RepID=UPI001C8A6793|nr:aminopeptidase N isoform X2 [Drosophila ficusphila]
MLGLEHGDIDFSTVNIISEVRLPSDILPLSYEVNIEPNFESQNFKGNIKMHLKWILDSKKVHFHADFNLIIDERSIKLSRLNMENGKTDGRVTILRGSRLPRKAIYVLHLKDKIKRESECLLEISFEGNIAEVAEGLFKSYYTNETNNVQEAYLATNFKPNNARRVFPCFDEPGIKVPFNLSIARPKDYITIFHTPLLNTIQHPILDNYWIDFFYITPPMSTHAFGFVISKLHIWNQVQMINSSDLPIINVWNNNLPSVILHDIQNKLNIEYKTIQRFFNVSLPLEKFDVIAIPDLPSVRFVSCYGMLIVRESELLKSGVFAFSRELVYQWIGIWITPDWWTDANLNKALISFIASEITIEINGGKEFNGKYPMTILYSLYYELSKRYPYSLITGMKKESTSFKTELFIRMLKIVLGEKTFRTGIQRFISNNKTKTFKGSDLWTALSKQAVEDKALDRKLILLDVAESWLKQSRLPLVTIKRDYNSGTAIVQQKVYLRERPHDVPDQDKMLWWIPITLVRQDTLNFSNSIPYIWMNKTKQAKISNLPSQDEFIIVNQEEIGPYLVNYDEKNWYMLSMFLRTENGRGLIPVYTRAKLLHDAWNLAYAGELNFAIALNMTLFLKNERNHIVWDPVFTFLDQIGKRFDVSSLHKKFHLYTIDLLAPLYETLGPENNNDDNWKTDLRKLTKTFICNAGYLPCIKASRNAFEVWLNSSNPNLNNPVPNEFICPVFMWGSMEEWMFGLERISQFPKLRLQSDRTFLLKMLSGCPAQREKINYLLELAILKNVSFFSENDKILIINMITTRSIGYTTLLDFLSSHWANVYQMFKNSTNLWNKLITSATGKFTTQEGYDTAKSFYNNHYGQFGRAQHIIERSLRNMKEEIQWSEQNLPVIEQWIDNYLSSTQFSNT